MQPRYIDLSAAAMPAIDHKLVKIIFLQYFRSGRLASRRDQTVGHRERESVTGGGGQDTYKLGQLYRY